MVGKRANRTVLGFAWAHHRLVALEATGHEAKASEQGGWPNRSCGYQTLNAKSAVLSSLSCPDAQRGIATPSTNSLIGTVPSHGSPSTKRLSFAIGCIWRPAISPLARSTMPGVGEDPRNLGSHKARGGIRFGTDAAMDPRGSPSGEPSLGAACARYSNH